MALLDQINSARASGASDDQILLEIGKQNPSVFSQIQVAQGQGAQSAQIIEEILKQNQVYRPIAEKKGFLESISQTYESAAQKFMSKKFGLSPYSIGDTVSAGGKLVGGFIGGIAAGVGTPIANIFSGNPVFKDLAQNVVKNAKKTGDFTGEIFEGGVVSFPTTLLGKIPNILLGTAQTKAGYDNLVSGFKTKDPVKISEGTLQLATGILGLKFSASEKGLILSKEFSSTLKPKPLTVKQATEKAVDVYRSVLRPEKGEIKRIEVQKGRDLNEIFTTLIDDGLEIGKTIENKLNTKDARAVIKERLEEAGKKIGIEIQKHPESVFNPFTLAKKVRKEVTDSNIAAVEKQEMRSDIDRLLEAEIAEKYGENWKETGVNPVFNGPEMNLIRQRMWKLGYNQGRPNAHKLARKIGHAIEQEISTTYKNTDLAALNKRYGLLADGLQLLENAHGRVVQGGRLGKELTGIMGTIVGATTPVPFAGPLAGYIGAKGLFDYISNPSRRTSRAFKKIQTAKKNAALQETLVKTIKKPDSKAQIIERFHPKVSDNAPCVRTVLRALDENPNAIPVRGMIDSSLNSATKAYLSNKNAGRQSTLEGFNHIRALMPDGTIRDSVKNYGKNRFFSEGEIIENLKGGL